MATDVQTMGTLRSNDGTMIAFEPTGEGPPVILVGADANEGVRRYRPGVQLSLRGLRGDISSIFRSRVVVVFQLRIVMLW